MKRNRIVFLGDSITWGFPWGPSHSWVSKLETVLKAEVINQGINGNTTSDMLKRFERAVLQYEPTHVVISGGINDVICGESFDRISWNFRDMAAKAQEKGIKVVFGTPTAVDDPFWEIPLVRLREWMTNYAREHHIALIPFHEAFYGEEGKIRTELLLADGGHPAQEGHRLMFKLIDLSIFD
ncbi:MAG: SGNH/GDSL hydrolase family protein [Syntrophomonadaceae bacterium]|jgi:acyl-CoA thioesterase-1